MAAVKFFTFFVSTWHQFAEMLALFTRDLYIHFLRAHWSRIFVNKGLDDKNDGLCNVTLSNPHHVGDKSNLVKKQFQISEKWTVKTFKMGTLWEIFRRRTCRGGKKSGRESSEKEIRFAACKVERRTNSYQYLPTPFKYKNRHRVIFVQMSKVIREGFGFRILRCVIGRKRLVPCYEPIRRPRFPALLVVCLFFFSFDCSLVHDENLSHESPLWSLWSTSNHYRYLSGIFLSSNIF